MTEPSTQTTKTIGTKNNFLGILKGVIAFLAVTLSLFHVFLESKSKEQIAYASTYKNTVKVLDSIQFSLLDQYETNKLTKSEFLELSRNHLTSYEPKLKEVSRKRKQLAGEHSFRGRSSLHFWIFVFGLVSALFYFSSKSLFDELSRGSTFKHQFVSLSGIIVSVFWFIHLIFFTQRDFNENNYILTILVCSLLFSGFTYFLIKYYSYKDQIIYNLIAFTKRVKTEYIHDLALRAKYSEKTKRILPENYSKSIDDTVDKFQKDLRNITSDI